MDGYHRQGFALLLLTLFAFANSALGCGYPGAPAHSALTFSGPELKEGVIATYACERGFELLGPSRRVCGEDGTWSPVGIPFCVLNVAAGKAPMQSSVAGTGVPQKAVDGSAANFFNPATCTLTQPERAPWWYVNLLEPYMVQLVRLDFGRSCCGDDQAATIVVRVGNNRPDLGVNPVCNKFTGVIEEGKPLFLPCNPPLAGAFVSVQLESPPGNALSICEAFVYTDQALPIERCPHFRDQPPGSTATYNGKCYIFYSQQQHRFEEARQFCDARGGSLVDDSNPALQGFLSWEMWRRHRSDPTAQYWLGAVRDPKDTNNWKWLNGRDVSVSFWNVPTGRGNCARFDGAKGWLWSDTNCNEALNFICQHGPKGCGRPEQPPNSTLLATSLEVGAVIEHRCDAGHLLVGPDSRTCQPNGFYSEFPPVCRYMECGFPAQVPNGHYTFLNGTRGYKSIVRYSCDEGHVMVGRSDLMCDIDQKWNGPPPRCDVLVCPEPPPVPNGASKVIQRTGNSLTVEYECDPKFTMSGPKRLVCADGSYDQPPPVCKGKPGVAPPVLIVTEASTTTRVSTTPTSGSTSSSSSTSSSTTANTGPQHEEDEYSEGHYDEGSQEEGSHNGIEEGSSSGQEDTQTVISVVTNTNSNSGDIEPSKPGPGLGVETELDDNDVSESNQILKAKRPNVDSPNSIEIQHRESAVARLNLGGIIALGVFGGFILLAAIVTSIILLIRRSQVKGKHERHRGSPDSHTITSVDSGSDAGLGRLYRRAWDSLAATGGPPTASTTVTDKSRGKVPRDTLDYRSRMSSVEGLRDEGEIIVHDALPTRKPHHHHHHHGHHHHFDGVGGGSEWGRSVRSHRSRY
ncbi:uncharacterized protein LOC110858395 isoform X2 [Folsomia candida]|uniref:uncharacterized protein LOC110858395 isoform X2 n=1 Tax=Folsomia candida TaxID=158441 RepID=UPI000B9096C3|nr:uncharacterized protein LOC110858395 isoform X2 [Folsomia candida]